MKKRRVRPLPIPRDAQRGAAMVTALMFMLVMLSFLALSMNTGILMDTRTELQLGSDAAALAAVGSLNGKADGLTAAKNTAVAYSALHRAYDTNISIDGEADVSFGRWHLKQVECTYGGGNDCFEPLGELDFAKINAVRVVNGRSAARNSPVSLTFGGFVGRETSDVVSSAIAIGPGVGSPDCSLPLAIAECKITDGDGNLLCDESSPQFVFSNANVDAIGYVNLYYPDGKPPNAKNTADLINNGGMCNQPKVGLAELHNGNDESNGMVIRALRGNAPDGSDCLIGKEQTMAVTNAGCVEGNPIFQGVQEVVGFIRATIVAVTNNRGVVMGCGDDVPVVEGTPEKNAIIMKIACETPAGSAGGQNIGHSGLRVRIVR